MKTRSTALYAYLFDAGVLYGTREEVDGARRAYRRLYKQQWRQARTPRREIRFGVTTEQFRVIRQKARECGLRHTAYARSAVLAAVESGAGPPPEEAISGALQLVSMAAISIERRQKTVDEVAGLLAQAERLLLGIVQSTL